MKILLTMSLAGAVIFTACNNDKGTAQPASTTTKDSTASQPSTGTKPTSSINEVLTGYLNLKNALANDNSKVAASAAVTISEAMNKIDAGALTAEQKKVYNDVQDDIKEHAEHIGMNEAKIAHQREHFEMISKDMYDLVKSFKMTQPLFKDFCPMYNDGKGAEWISETKEIKNPYLGKKMPDCGEVKEEIK